MFLHIGENTDIFINDIVLIINLPHTKEIEHLNAISLSENPKTLVVTNYKGTVKYYLCGVRVSALKRRIINTSKLKLV